MGKTYVPIYFHPTQNKNYEKNVKLIIEPRISRLLDKHITMFCQIAFDFLF